MCHDGNQKTLLYYWTFIEKSAFVRWVIVTVINFMYCFIITTKVVFREFSISERRDILQIYFLNNKSKTVHIVNILDFIQNKHLHNRWLLDWQRNFKKMEMSQMLKRYVGNTLF